MIAHTDSRIFEDDRLIWQLPEGEVVKTIGLWVTTEADRKFYMDLANREPVLVRLP